jgi:hypothetical protein
MGPPNATAGSYQLYHGGPGQLLRFRCLELRLDDPQAALRSPCFMMGGPMGGGMGMRPF